MHILVTGADGFVGTHLCRHLSKSYRVTANVLPAQKDYFFEKWGNQSTLNLTVIAEEIRNLSSDRIWLNSITHVVHCAGTMLGSKYEYYLDANLKTTKSLIEILHPKLEKFIFLSSQSALGPSSGPDIKPTPSATPQPISYYGETKLMAEKEILNSNLPFVIFRPSPVLGPEDRTFLEIFQTAAQGKFPILGQKDKQFQFVYVNDLVLAIEKALLSAVTRKLYHVAYPDAANWAQMKSAMEMHLHKKLKVLFLNPTLTSLYLRFYDFMEALTGKRTNKNHNKFKEMMAPYWLFDTSDFVKDTGFSYQSNFNDTISSTFSWYEKNSWTHPSGTR